jgi:hypothetical protein
MASMLTGRAYTPSAKGLAVKDAIERRLSDGRIDPLDYSSFGYESRDAMLRDSKGVVSTKFGTLQHATMENANEIFNMLSGIRNKFGDDTDIAKRIDGIKDGGLNYSKLTGLGDLADMLKAEGFVSESSQIQSSIAKVQGLG